MSIIKIVQTDEVVMGVYSDPTEEQAADCIFSLDADNISPYNFVATVAGEWMLDLLAMGWIADGKQIYRLRIRFEASGNIHVVDTDDIHNVQKSIDNISRMVSGALGKTVKARYYHGRQARKFVKRNFCDAISCN